jgi:hypothetical protein
VATSQPAGLSVDLFEFQLSTYQWMLDQELDEGGLNRRFWDEWVCEDGGGSMFYFPLAGEFRLVAPPRTTGGLLCEEMGLGENSTVKHQYTILCILCASIPLIHANHTKSIVIFFSLLSNIIHRLGKTVELLALLLGNRHPSISKESPQVVVPSKGRIRSRATLIVVPTTLVGQWWSELHHRVKPELIASGDFQVINIAGRNLKEVIVPASDFMPPLKSSKHLMEVQFRLPWGANNKVRNILLLMTAYTSCHSLSARKFKFSVALLYCLPRNLALYTKCDKLTSTCVCCPLPACSRLFP